MARQNGILKRHGDFTISQKDIMFSDELNGYDQGDYWKYKDGENMEQVEMCFDGEGRLTIDQCLVLETRPRRFVFVFTPNHEAQLNLIENFLGKMARQQFAIEYIKPMTLPQKI